jgi:hypothetical protein
MQQFGSEKQEEDFYALITQQPTSYPHLHTHEACTGTHVQRFLCKRIIINEKFCPCENKRKLGHCNCIASNGPSETEPKCALQTQT